MAKRLSGESADCGTDKRGCAESYDQDRGEIGDVRAFPNLPYRLGAKDNCHQTHCSCRCPHQSDSVDSWNRRTLYVSIILACIAMWQGYIAHQGLDATKKALRLSFRSASRSIKESARTNRATNKLVEIGQSQAAAALASAATAQNQLESSQRAWVVFKPSLPWPVLTAGRKYQVELMLQNVGHSPAHGIKTHIAYTLGDQCGMPEKIELLSPPTAEIGVMAPDVEYPLTTASPFVITPEVKRQLSPDTDVVDPCVVDTNPKLQVLRLYLKTTYSDEFSRDRGMRACLEYNPWKERHFTFCRYGNEAW